LIGLRLPTNYEYTTYVAVLTQYAEFIKRNRYGDLRGLTLPTAQAYLASRASDAGPEALELERRIGQYLLGEQIPLGK